MRSLDPRLLRECRGARLHLAAAVAMGFASAICVIAGAVLLAHIVTEGFGGDSSVAELRPSLVALAAVLGLRALMAGGFEFSGRLGAARAMSELRRKLVAHLMDALPAGLARERTGELVGTLVQGVDLLEDYFARYLPQLVLAAIVPPAILIYVVTVDWTTALVLLITLPLIPVFMILIGKQAEETTQRQWAALSLLGAHFLDVVRGLLTLRSHNRAAAQVDAIAGVSDRYRIETMGTLRVAFLSSLVLELIAMIGTALVAAIVGVQLVNGIVGLQAGLTVLILAPEMYRPLRQVGQQFHASAAGITATQRIFDLLDAPPAVTACGRAPVPDLADAAIEFDHVRFEYGDREGAGLFDFSLRVEAGEFVAIAGPTGSGKSTAAALLMRFLEPHSGRITCDGTDLREIDPDGWRARIAWVPQRPHIFAGSLADNIRMGSVGASDSEVSAVALRVGLAPMLGGAPEGLATRVGDGGRPLSAGEVRRVALARALLRDAPLIVLDEPVAHLDPGSISEMAAVIAAAAKGRTVLMIVHEPQLAGVAGRVVTMPAPVHGGAESFVAREMGA